VELAGGRQKGRVVHIRSLNHEGLPSGVITTVTADGKDCDGVSGLREKDGFMGAMGSDAKANGGGRKLTRCGSLA